MSKEIEIKVLEIDIDKIIKKLEEIGAKLKFDKVQQIYTYDFFSISGTYNSILYTFNKNNSEKSVIHSIKILKNLFADVNDLLDLEDKTAIKDIIGYDNLIEFSNSIREINEENMKKLNDEKLIKIIEKYDINPNKWIRLRRTGNKSSITVKQIFNRKNNKGIRTNNINDVKEVEVFVDDFEKAKELLNELGYYHKNYQEKRRICYEYNNIEIDIDMWPHIPPYMEIEAPCQEDIYTMLNKLNYCKKDAVVMNTDDVYSYYGLDLYSYKELRFVK